MLKAIISKALIFLLILVCSCAHAAESQSKKAKAHQKKSIQKQKETKLNMNEIMDIKLNQYDKSRRTINNQTYGFNLYYKSCMHEHCNAGGYFGSNISKGMMEQRNNVSNFATSKYGPIGINTETYGFRLDAPLQNNLNK